MCPWWAGQACLEGRSIHLNGSLLEDRPALVEGAAGRLAVAEVDADGTSGHGAGRAISEQRILAPEQALPVV